MAPIRTTEVSVSAIKKHRSLADALLAKVLPDLTTLGEARVEAWAAENVIGDIATCQCGNTFKLSQGESLSPSPYTIPVCIECIRRD